MLCDAPIFALPEGNEDFVVYCNASNQGLGCFLMQRGFPVFGVLHFARRGSRVNCWDWKSRWVGPAGGSARSRAVGGSVPHCGWNSLLESLWFGVLVATWPLYAEHQINAFEMMVDLESTVEITLDYKRDLFNPTAETIIVTAKEIESGIRRVMEDDLVRTQVKKMSDNSRSTTMEGGSSYSYIGFLIQDVITHVS
ncbi:UDP-glycosyltransferase 71A15-like [Bidens hawaiensis]|uniref:UDP-glycosyltransferase 71A15-like n=1 Tax=Bidens hawaiensis TaxID=980011 RepID=UPI00404AEDFB